MKPPQIICFGEVLWDLLPSGKKAGGAPMNVAFHSKNFGMESKMISRVGAGDLGRELMEFLESKNIPTSLIQTDPQFPTSIVNVKLDSSGSASYEIVQPVAWDFIEPKPRAKKAVKEAEAIIFGSLACRSDKTKETLLELLKIAKLRIFDVNLRPPFYSQALLEELLEKSDVVKMNDEELTIISEWYNQGGSESAQMDSIKRKFGIDVLIVTKGKYGAACMDETGYHTHPGFPVKVADTVGSGDSFFAAFLYKMLSGNDSKTCLKFASATGALVATKTGGTPELNEKIVLDFMEYQSKN